MYTIYIETKSYLYKLQRAWRNIKRIFNGHIDVSMSVKNQDICVIYKSIKKTYIKVKKKLKINLENFTSIFVQTRLRLKRCWSSSFNFTSVGRLSTLFCF